MARSAAKTATPSAAGYASVALPDGYADETYSESIVRTLKEHYGLSVAGASKNPSLRWEAVDTLPPGLSIQDSTGVIFGTPVRPRAQPYVFRLHVFDDSVANPSPLRLQLSIAVLNGPRPGPAPVLMPVGQNESAEQSEPIVQTAATNVGDGQDDSSGKSGANVEVPSIVPRKETTVPLTINDPDIRQLKVSVLDKDDKVLDKATTPEDLPRGVQRTSVKVKLQEGENWIRIANADTNEVYKTIRVVLKASDVDKPAPPPPIQILHSGVVTKDATKTPVTVVVSDNKINKVKVTTSSKDDKGAATTWAGDSKTLDLKRGLNEYTQEVPVDPDSNHITVVNVASVTDDPKKSVSADKPLEIKRGKASEEKPKAQVITSGLVSDDIQVVPSQIIVNDRDITKIRVVVTPVKKKDEDEDKEKTIVDSHIIGLSRETNSVLQAIELPSKHDATVRLYDLTKVEEPKASPDNLKQISAETEIPLDPPVIIRRREGGASPPVSTIPTNSMTTRAIVGFEQTGASAADSESKPFLDFFFTAPIRFKPKLDELPRFSTWGQVRLAALPQQVSTFGTFASNFVNPLAEGKLVNLVQGFDFMAGLEARVFGTNKSYVGLIPGVKQQTFMHVMVGGGAISPLSTPRSGAQIFAVPGADSPQRQLFIDRFGQEAANKQYIAFVFPDRDRFLRQYYAGVRFKTFYYAGDGSLINRFPAMLDVTIGQNEAVTGGKLKNDVTNEKGRIIGRKRNYVLRLEAFYPFPIKEASFLYLYGTAMMKVGGGGVKIDKPLFLDTAPSNISITGNDVFIAPTLQSNRDYYRFGIGVNLNDLFNRKPPPEEK
jgi:hypothetical protein